MTARMPRVAIVGTGGTISSVGRGKLDLGGYMTTGKVWTVSELLARIPEVHRVANIVPVPFEALHSTAIGPTHWARLAAVIENTFAEDETLDGLVVTHGTATLEETAYFLHLTLKTAKPVVLVGAQRPPTGLSSDAHLNMVNAVRTAGCPDAAGLGVLICLNDEVHSAREATKTSTFRLQTFRSADFGLLGHADPDRISIYRQPTRAHTLETPFSASDAAQAPRVEIVYSYAGSDGGMIRAAAGLGAKGIVTAAFAPGLSSRTEREAIKEVTDAGIIVTQSTRAMSGRVVEVEGMRPRGCIVADNLTPQKARILLMLGLARSSDPAELQDYFNRF